MFMQVVPIPLDLVYLEAAALSFYLVALNTLPWKFIYEMPSRAVLGLVTLLSMALMFHAGLGIVLVVVDQMEYMALSWVALWGVLIWINRERIAGIFRGYTASLKDWTTLQVTFFLQEFGRLMSIISNLLGLHI
jgi:hypothetical protein